MSDTSPSRRPLDVAAAIRLYVDDELTVRQIAARLRYSHTTIHELLVGAGVQLRPRGSRAKCIPAATRAAIVAGYVAGERVAVLRARHKVSAQSIRNVVAEGGVPLRRGGSTLAGHRRFDREGAAALAAQEWPAAAIAILTGFSEGHVRRELRALGYGRKAIPEGEELAMAYDRAGSIRRLAAELGCSAGRVKNALERDGIKRLPKAEELKAMVRMSGGRATAAKLGCSVRRLRAALEHAGVTVRVVAAVA
ncbi:hypothetical protein ACFOY2_45775 [Nonomuraea purpurea]|uniref:Helix-turn-helix domain containing protein n=1 Tax=Nonomuraea purpurea TaxID=1849276 RepID=A0ABV8GKX4_9ACTN